MAGLRSNLRSGADRWWVVRRVLLLGMALLAPSISCDITYIISGAVTPSSLGAGTMLTLIGTPSGSQIVAADSSGNYRSYGLPNGSYTVTPSKTGERFSPASQTVTISGSSVGGINFTAQPAGISLVQNSANGSEAALPTISVAFPSNNTQGDLLIVTGTAANPPGTLAI